ncbi:phage tail protein [Achromobacter xylosoxidans]|uniref:phage tail protein n=1 Tax=Alcaligenes xylosoxydans xylosoxydans TaxID=85698 RepID=UPI001F1D3D2E|nr:phage tail protein [Achromobacter xylosoxidans]
MDLLIAPNTVTQERADTAPATGTPGWATDGNPATNTPATQWPAYAFNAIQAELMGVIQAPGDIDPDRHDNGQVAAAIKRLIAVAVQNRPLCFSISDLPTEDVGPIVVAECGEVWIWSQSAYFTGYRSPLCGRPVDGHTLAPLASEVDAVGGLLPKVAYARLWGYARENGLVVSQAFWDANKGGHYFVDVDANTFRVPDLRDMFRRFTGTDADTANARPLGSRRSDHGAMLTAANLRLSRSDREHAVVGRRQPRGLGAQNRRNRLSPDPC